MTKLAFVCALWTLAACSATVDDDPDGGGHVTAYARAFCSYVERCGEVALACADRPSGSSCVATLGPSSLETCDKEVEETALGCDPGPDRRLYEDCRVELGKAECVTQEALDAYYSEPMREPSDSPELAVLPESCRTLRAELAELAELDSRPSQR